MAFRIKVSGQTHEAQPPPPGEDIKADPMNWSHAGFLAWEAYCGMGVARDQALKHYRLYEQLEKEIDAEGIDHPKWGAALSRLWEFEGFIILDQISFLNEEKRAESAWRALTPDIREEEGLSEWFKADPHDETLLPMWKRPMSNSFVPHFGVSHTALMVVPPSQSKAYRDVGLIGMRREKSREWERTLEAMA